MTSGMLWWCGSKGDLAAKIKAAAAYYKKKYGRAPELCLINPNVDISGIGTFGGDVNPITVRHSKIVLPGHLWIGVEEMPTKAGD